MPKGLCPIYNSIGHKDIKMTNSYDFFLQDLDQQLGFYEMLTFGKD